MTPVDQIVLDLSQRSPPAENPLESYLFTGLMTVTRRNLETARAEWLRRRDTPARRVAVLLTGRYTEHWTIKQLARAVGQSRSRLEPEFKREFSTSIHKFLTMRRIGHAKHLLDVTDVKVETIALDVGFRSKKAFYDAFAQATGLTPMGFRKRAHFNASGNTQ